MAGLLPEPFGCDAELGEHLRGNEIDAHGGEAVVRLVVPERSEILEGDRPIRVLRPVTLDGLLEDAVGDVSTTRESASSWIKRSSS